MLQKRALHDGYILKCEKITKIHIVMQKKITAIIQARIGSTRLPRKVLLEIEKKPMLHYVIKQVSASNLIDEIIIATSTCSEDDIIADYCKKLKIKCFRGSVDDVLDRYYKCAKKFSCETIVRITSDCPLIDPLVIDNVITKFKENSYDYVSNNVKKIGNSWQNDTCNFPQGMTVEVSTFSALEKAWKNAKKPSEQEHVFPYIQSNPQIFRISSVRHYRDLSHIRCTVDRINDFKFVQEIYRRASPAKKFLSIRDILQIVRKEPELLQMNNNIPFDEGYKKSIVKDAELGYK
jgi:spore coat polysaccharide biosynthesis protein SpsF